MNNPALQRSGILFVLSAPSGAGKTTLRNALRALGDLEYAVSCTTRPPRPGEHDGIDYHFLDPAEFDRRALAGEFLEHALVHSHRYGTLKLPLLEHLRAGRDVLLDIDIAGASSIRSCGDPVILRALADVFLMPPGIGELRHRLERRGTESAEEIEKRLRTAEEEMKSWTHYRYLIPSRSVEQTLGDFRSILAAERCLARRFFPPQSP